MVKNPLQWRSRRRHGFDPCVGKIPWRRKRQPITLLLPGESHGQRSLTDYSPWGCKESDMTEQLSMYQFSSVQSLSRVQLFATPWTAARQAPLSVTNSWSLLKLMSIESVMPSNHLILCRPLLLSPSIFPSIRVPLSMGLPRQEYWSGLPCPPPRDLPNPGIKPRSPTLQADSLPSEPSGDDFW